MCIDASLLLKCLPSFVKKITLNQGMNTHTKVWIHKYQNKWKETLKIPHHGAKHKHSLINKFEKNEYYKNWHSYLRNMIHKDALKIHEKRRFSFTEIEFQ